MASSESWKQEAEAVINDVKTHVNYIKVSEKLESSDYNIYLNIITIENQRFTVQLSNQGFRIVGHNFDENNINSDTFYETPYSLLNEISKEFRQSFANSLQNQLNNLLT